MVALHVCQVWWTLAYKPLRPRRHKSRRTLCQGRSVRACVHSVGMLCGYMPNSSYYYYYYRVSACSVNRRCMQISLIQSTCTCTDRRTLNKSVSDHFILCIITRRRNSNLQPSILFQINNDQLTIIVNLYQTNGLHYNEKKITIKCNKVKTTKRMFQCVIEKCLGRKGASQYELISSLRRYGNISVQSVRSA